jgi:capsid portal protein
MSTLEQKRVTADASVIALDMGKTLERRNDELLSVFPQPMQEEKADKPKGSRAATRKGAAKSQEYTQSSKSPVEIRAKYPLSVLELVIEECPELSRTIKAHSIGTGGQGFKLLPLNDRSKLDEVTDAAKIAEIENERDELDAFFRYICPNRSANDVIGLVLEGRRRYAFGAWEILRNTLNQVVGVNPIEDLKTIKICAVDEQVITVDRQIRIGNRIESQPEQRRFRRFIQEIRPNRSFQASTIKKTYFKEFLDPRPMNSKTGEFWTQTTPPPAEWQLATEILWFPIVAVGDEIPAPEWIPGLPDVLAARAIRIVNLDILDNNATPPMAVIVEGANNPKLASLIRDQLKAIKGRESRSKAVIIQVEAEPAGSGTAKEVIKPSVRIENLSSILANEGMFLKYLDWLDKSICALFRLPQIIVGKVESTLNRATAEEAIRITEQMVFQPERNAIEMIINDVFLPEVSLWSQRPNNQKGVKHWRFALNNFSVDRTDATVKVLNAGKEDLTLNERRSLLDSIIPGELPLFPEEEANVPPSLKGSVIASFPDDSKITQSLKAALSKALGKDVRHIAVLDLESLHKK